MICAGTLIFLYFFIGWVVSYEAHKRDWNSELHHYDHARLLTWWLIWPWFGSLILSKRTAGWGDRFANWGQASLEGLYDRMTEFNWRKDDEANS